MANTVIQTYTSNQAFVAPAGVTLVDIVAINAAKPFDQNNIYCGLIDNTGKMWNWGWNGTGGVGDGTTSNRSSPVAVPGGLLFSKFWKYFSYGTSNNNTHISFALTTTGALYAWGNGSVGFLGTNTGSSNQSSPVLVSGGLTWANFLPPTNSTSSYPVFAITPGGQLYGWGLNSGGYIGDGTASSRSSPVLVAGGLTWSQVFSSGDNTFGITQTGVLYGWGQNSSGTLGVGTSTAAYSSPVAVVGGITSWSQIIVDTVSNAYQNVYGITYAGVLYGWGNNANGQIGDGTISSRSSPTLVLGSLKVQQVSLMYDGGTNVLALTTSGQIYGWGSNFVGGLGNGTSNSVSSPTLVVGGLTWAALYVPQAFLPFSTGGETIFGVTTSGALYGWGANTVGQIGDGTTSTRSSPVLVLGGLSGLQIKQFTMSYDNNVSQGISYYALLNNGSLYAWGENADGALGDGTSSSRSSPVLVAGGLTWAFISVFNGGATIPGGSPGRGVFGVTTSGQIYAWGSQQFGELGIGVNTFTSSPVAVVGGLGPASVPGVAAFTLPVVPGQSYNINFGEIYSYFGTQLIGQQQLAQIIVSYEQ